MIEWRDTDGGPRFCVIARADDGAGEVPIAHSPPLNWPPKGAASVRELTDAAETLEAALVAAGWRPLPQQGSAWYAKRFVGEPAPESPPSVEVAANRSTARRGAQPAARARPDAERWGTGSESSERPVGRRHLLIATAGQLVLAAAIIGLLLGRAFASGDDAPVRAVAATPTIVHGGLRVQVPSGWARGQAAAVPGFSRPLSLRNPRQHLSAVAERLPASSASLLPVAFEKARPSAAARRVVVRLTPGQFAWRYRVANGNGSATVLYAAPTTSGVATVACVVPTDARVPRGCETLVKAITVPGSLPLALGTNVAFYTRLPAVARQLEAVRSTAMRDLSAATSSVAQAAAADALVRAHQRAFAALAPLTGEGAGLPGEVVRGLNAMAGAYATLARAARAHSPRRYDRAGLAVSDADAELRRTLAQAAAAANAASPAPTEAGRLAP